jgi:Ring hydroxylating alpha subunit (catalytic domain)
VDTFLEAYHLAALHQRSVGPIFVSNLCASDAFGVHHRMVAVRRSLDELTDRREAERDFLRHTIELYTLFPNTVFVYQADHLEVWRMFPGDRPDRCTVHLALYVPEPAVTETARRHWTANLQLAIDAVDTEDFRLGEGIQRGFGSGAQDHVTYGRNEPALIHFHRSLRRALGVQG